MYEITVRRFEDNLESHGIEVFKQRKDNEEFEILELAVFLNTKKRTYKKKVNKIQSIIE